jgi:hypothetical protein
MQQFEFSDYSGERVEPVVTVERFRESSAARAYAGRLAKRNGGPVDLALAGAAPWNDRYITTAAPCEFNVSGYRFERLDG